MQHLPKIVRFLGGHLAFGLAIGTAFASLLVLTNAAGLNDLISGDNHPYLATFLLLFLFALTFGSVAMGVGIMTMPADKPSASEKEQP